MACAGGGGGDLNQSLKPTCCWAQQERLNWKNTNTFSLTGIAIPFWVKLQRYCVDRAAMLVKCDQNVAKRRFFCSSSLGEREGKTSRQAATKVRFNKSKSIMIAQQTKVHLEEAL